MKESNVTFISEGEGLPAYVGSGSVIFIGPSYPTSDHNVKFCLVCTLCHWLAVCNSLLHKY